MKKNLFFAMMAICVMASCSKDSDVAGGSDNDQEAAIQLSVTSQNARATTKGIGMVGGQTTETNVWNGETVNIYAIEKHFPTGTTTYDTYSYQLTNDGVSTTVNGDLLLINNEPAIAPTATVEPMNQSKLAWKDNITRYFPRTKAYDFFGYHIDDASTGDPKIIEVASKDSAIAVPFIIDGSQDLMVAKAVLTDAQKALLTDPADPGKAYSAYTARKGVQPNMTFNHLLTQLNFNVYAGNEGGENVFIKEIRVKSKNTGKLLVVYNPSVTDYIQWEEATEKLILQEEAQPASSTANLVMLNNGITWYTTSAEVYNNIQNVPETKPADVSKFGKYYPVWDDAEGATQKATVVGAGLLVAPAGTDYYEVEFDVVQYYDIDGNKIPFTQSTYSYPTQKINPPTEGESKGLFLAGYAYNINLTVWGLQKIDITAELTAWKDGGSIPIDPDNEF